MRQYVDVLSRYDYSSGFNNRFPTARKVGKRLLNPDEQCSPGVSIMSSYDQVHPFGAGGWVVGL